MVAYGFKKQFIPAIELGLKPLHHFDYDPEKIVPKRQTVRAIGKRRHARPGETMQLYTAMRTKQCRKLGEAICQSVQPIKLFLGAASLGVDLDGRYFCGATETEEFARDDGFSSVEEMIRFWLVNHPGVQEFTGVLIKWEKPAK